MSGYGLVSLCGYEVRGDGEEGTRNAECGRGNRDGRREELGRMIRGGFWGGGSFIIAVAFGEDGEGRRGQRAERGDG